MEQTEKKSLFRKATDKLFGGLNMSWLTVILFAVGTAVVTSFFLIVPFFLNTSFALMGATFEAWIFFAVIIMSNCKKPLESALKTLVFFLISQPLIYLFQVPFSWLGWELFGYYPYWFVWTLLTFPMALAGWFIKKKNWLSLLILSPVLAFLTHFAVSFGKEAFFNFPYHLIAALFCAGQVALYIYVFLSNWKQRLAAAVIPAAVTVIMLISIQNVNISLSGYSLPDAPVLSKSAVVQMDDSGIAEAVISDYSEGSVDIQGHRLGETGMKITDGEKEYFYTVTVSYDGGSSDIIIKPSEAHTNP